MVFMAGGFLFVLEPVAASDLADLGALGISVPGNKVKETPGSPRQLHAALGTVPQGKGVESLALISNASHE